MHFITEFERLWFKKSDNIVVSNNNEPANIAETVTSLISDVVADTLPYDAADEVPCAIGDTTTLASQLYNSYHEICPRSYSRSLDDQGENAAVDPTFQQALAWNLDDNWRNWGSQTPGAELQSLFQKNSSTCLPTDGFMSC